MRVFLDTNVLVSAFATRGLCADVLRHVLTEHDLLVGQVVLRETLRVLRSKIKLPAVTIREVEGFLRQYALIPKPRTPVDIPIRDPDDRWILASAIEGNAEVLVTGDHDLLDIATDSPIPILNPRGFWTLMRSKPRAD